MTEIAKASKCVRPDLDELCWRIRVEPAPDGERNREVMNNRRPAHHRSPPKRNTDTAVDGVIDVLARLRADAGAQSLRDREDKTLVWPRIAQRWTYRLQSFDFRWPICRP